MPALEWMLEPWVLGTWGWFWLLASLALQTIPGETRREGGRS
jgi:hypothetical protein